MYEFLLFCWTQKKIFWRTLVTKELTVFHCIFVMLWKSMATSTAWLQHSFFIFGWTILLMPTRFIYIHIHIYIYTYIYTYIYIYIYIYIYCWCVYSECLLHSQALEEEKVVYDRSSSKNIYLNVAVNTLKKLRSKSTPTSPVISASNTNTQINTPVIMSFPLCIYWLISRCSSEVTEVH